MFSACDSALTVLMSDAINLSKFIEASEQRLQSRYFSALNQFEIKANQHKINGKQLRKEYTKNDANKDEFWSKEKSATLNY